MKRTQIVLSHGLIIDAVPFGDDRKKLAYVRFEADEKFFGALGGGRGEKKTIKKLIRILNEILENT